MNTSEKLTHPIDPVFDENSRILILGSFPSPKSREYNFFYGHPQNIFWYVLATVLNQPPPAATGEARRQFAIDHRIALWDVLHSCCIIGANDSKITEPIVNDFSIIFATADIRAIFTTGKKATQLYEKFSLPKTGRPSIYLPSTSPANRAGQNKPQFWDAWSKIRNYLTAGDS